MDEVVQKEALLTLITKTCHLCDSTHPSLQNDVLFYHSYTHRGELWENPTDHQQEGPPT